MIHATRSRRYQRTAQRISSGSVCRHLKIAGRIVSFMIASGYQPPSAKVATQPLEPFGWNQEDTEWVAMVCLNSGVFIRSQYMAYFNTYHLRAARFVQNLVNLKLAVDEEIPVISTKNRTRACRITHKSIYRELGIPNVRHRKIARSGRLSPAAPVARLRDRPLGPRMAPHRNREGLVLQTSGHQEGPPAEAALYRGGRYLTRYFPLKLPIAAGRIVTFVYVDPGNDTITEMRYWGQTHEYLWAGLRHRGITIYVAVCRRQA